MIELHPNNQKQLFGLDKYLLELINLYEKDKLPNKILLSGLKGLGKSTLAYHLINYILSENEDFKYDKAQFKIDDRNKTFKTIQNRSNLNFRLIDINSDKKTIDINQIRELIVDLNKSSFNKKPRFVLIDNIDLLNVNAINALLKILEEPSDNTYFILINNNKKILPTLLSRCLNFNIFLNHDSCLKVLKNILDINLNNLLKNDFINYYSSPGNIFQLVKFAKQNEYDLENTNLKEFLNLIIKKKNFIKNEPIKFILFELIELYFRKLNLSITSYKNDKYSNFLKKVSDTKRFNLDLESLFTEFSEEILNG
tara:strand:- start:602 stop:1534 length:933 start_codon:yes stop_codon:yes gene_type:complete